MGRSSAQQRHGRGGGVMLTWHTEAEPCLLAGVPVTSEAWQGGVVAAGPPYGDLTTWRIAAHPAQWWGAHQPIFPPAGWAGLSDWEIMQLLWPKGEWDKSFAKGERWELFINCKGEISLAAGDVYCGSDPYDPYVEERVIDAPALILALQNAQVLAQRLATPEAP